MCNHRATHCAKTKTYYFNSRCSEFDICPTTTSTVAFGAALSASCLRLSVAFLENL